MLIYTYEIQKIIVMYNINKFKLGKLCNNNHEYENTGQSLRYIKSGECQQCIKEQNARHNKKIGRASNSKSFPRTNNLEEAISYRTDKKSSNECWEWQGQRRKPKANAKSGYGRLEFKGKQYTAHRLAWELHNKTTVPEGYVVCHVCDNPCCVNPSHLFLGSNQDNMDDMKRKKRQCKGEDKHIAKLSKKDVEYIKSLPKGFNQSELARQFNVYPSTISAIVNNKNWKHI